MNAPAQPQEDANVPITNTLFPPPPDFYKAYADDNLRRSLELRGGPSNTSKARAGAAAASGNVDVDGLAAPDFDLNDEQRLELTELRALLDKPRADWVSEEGRWMSFGEIYTTEPKIPTAESIGLPRFVDPDEEPQTSFPPLLHSFLHTLLLLLDVLTNTARIPGELEEKGWAHEGDQYIQHMTNLAATLMVSANQLRGVQAEATLVLLMERQLAIRREQTAALQDKCKAIASRLKELKVVAAEAGV
ncbi:Mediator of RNA polymerase II transcription subunit 7 [Saitozyma podzolica]|uniref:Mediator of RNA polymerase II transcription subunit 7 n=1 Tax=Saitozyma podzolica TaxID=1890683 RepID=A0A427YLT9_9TREE|nr:Mediator of RNA polymerase II transcription subunit 7 [Saitozyma podzolica]